jgi:hypothetical protein
MIEFCGEIAYFPKDTSVHSDICKHNDGPITDTYRKFLHDCLDEWLTNASGTGAFWVGDPKYFEEQ